MKQFKQNLNKIYNNAKLYFVLLLKIVTFILIVTIVILGAKKWILVVNEDDHNIISRIDYSDYDVNYTSITDNNESIDGAYLNISSAKIFKNDNALQERDFDQLYDVSSITVGDTIVYQLTYGGNIKAIDLHPGHIGLYGFSGKIDLVQDNNNPRLVYLMISDIKTSNDEIYITINGGTAISSTAEMANSVVTNKLKVYQDDATRLALWLFPDGNALLTIVAAIMGLIYSIKTPNKHDETHSENSDE